MQLIFIISGPDLRNVILGNGAFIWRVTGQKLGSKAGCRSNCNPAFPNFFDLVFVFALIQLSHALASDFSSTAAIESFSNLCDRWVWISTTWVGFRALTGPCQACCFLA